MDVKHLGQKPVHIFPTMEIIIDKLQDNPVLNKGTILVDDDVYEIAIKYKWYARSNGKYYRVYTFVNINNTF